MDARVARIFIDRPNLREAAVGPHRNRRASFGGSTIVATMVGIIVAFVVLMALMRTDVPPTATVIAPPVPLPQVEQFGAIQAVRDRAPAPAQLPPPVLPPVSSDSNSVAETAPVLKSGSVQSEKQAGGRVTGVEVLVPGVGKGATTGRSDLTAAEKTAIARGAKELKNTAAINAPRRPVRTRSALTKEEKAAVERGLRELKKAAGQAKQ